MVHLCGAILGKEYTMFTEIKKALVASALLFFMAACGGTSTPAPVAPAPAPAPMPVAVPEPTRLEILQSVTDDTLAASYSITSPNDIPLSGGASFSGFATFFHVDPRGGVNNYLGDLRLFADFNQGRINGSITNNHILFGPVDTFGDLTSADGEPVFGRIDIDSNTSLAEGIVDGVGYSFPVSITPYGPRVQGLGVEAGSDFGASFSNGAVTPAGLFGRAIRN